MYKFITTFCKVMVVFMLVGAYLVLVGWLGIRWPNVAMMFVIVSLAVLVTFIIHGD